MDVQIPSSKATLVVVPLGKMGNLIPTVIAANIQGVLNIPVYVGKSRNIPDECYMNHRRQYDAGLILKFLKNIEKSHTYVLGVTRADISLPIFTYVFGEAELGGRAAVMSIHRLDRDVHGGHILESVLFERIAKVALHEVGHLFSLYHCNNHHCIMQFSSTIETLDTIPLYFCDRCHFLVKRIISRTFE